MSRTTLKVEGMSCEHCRLAVTRAVSSVPGVSRVEVSLEAKSVSFDCEEGSVALAGIKQAIEAEGYRVAG